MGSGLYVDGDVGGAGATGRGENIMRHCTCFQCVSFMRAGMTPQDACEETIHQIAKKEGTYMIDVCIIALDVHGTVGAAASNQTFPYAMSSSGISQILEVHQVKRR